MDRDILVYGYYGRGNFGDDILASATLQSLCDVVDPRRIQVFAPKNCYLDTWFPGVCCDRKIPYSIKRVIFGGGGLFFAYPRSIFDRLWGWKSATAATMQRRTKHLNCKKFGFCVGIGPLYGVGAKIVTKHFLSNFDYLSVRDISSLQILKDFKIDQCSLATDLSISLLPVLNTLQKPKTISQRIGIIVREWSHSNNSSTLLLNLQKTIEHFKKNGVPIDIILMQSPKFDKSQEKISTFFKNEKQLIWDPSSMTISGFCNEIINYSFIISMRAHGILLGGLLNIPTLGITIDPKIRYMSEMIGTNSMVLPESCTFKDIIFFSERFPEKKQERNWDEEKNVLDNETIKLTEWLISQGIY